MRRMLPLIARTAICCDVILVSLLLFTVVPICRADHPDAAHRPSDKAESMLSGVYINSSLHNSIRDEDGVLIEPLANVIKTLGEPSAIRKINNCESDLVWNRDGIRVEVGSGCIFQKIGGKNVMRTHGAYSVEVWGARPRGGIGITGRGLALGDSISTMKRLYGMRCDCGRYLSGTGAQKTYGQRYVYYAQYIWGDSAELNVDIDPEGRIVHILLRGDLE